MTEPGKYKEKLVSGHCFSLLVDIMPVSTGHNSPFDAFYLLRAGTPAPTIYNAIIKDVWIRQMK